jgi:hypothetical protein
LKGSLNPPPVFRRAKSATPDSHFPRYGEGILHSRRRPSTIGVAISIQTTLPPAVGFFFTPISKLAGDQGHDQGFLLRQCLLARVSQALHGLLKLFSMSDFV